MCARRTTVTFVSCLAAFDISHQLELQEILYPEFCSILVRFASERYSMVPGIANRVNKLLIDSLLPLLDGHTKTPMHMLEADTAFCQYLQLIDPVMKIIFTAAVQKITVRFQQSYSDQFFQVQSRGGHNCDRV